MLRAGAGRQTFKRLSGIAAALDLIFTNGSLDSRITYTGQNGTYFDSTGTLQQQAVNQPRFDYDPTQYYPNLLTYPESFENAAWARTRVNVGINTTVAPNGLLSMDKIYDDTATGQHNIAITSAAVTSGATLSASAYFKAGEYSSGWLQVNTAGFSTGFRAQFNLSTGTVTSATFGTGTVSAVSITPDKNGIYRVVATGTLGATTSAVVSIFLNNGASYLGDGVSGLYAWGAKLEEGSVATPYDNSQLVAQNLIPVSENFSNTSYYALSNSTLSTTTDVPPSGPTTASRVIENTSFSTHGITLAVGAYTHTVGVPYTVSAYAKYDGSRYLRIGPADTVAKYAFFDLLNGVQGTVDSGLSVAMSPLGNGWYRCSVTWIATIVNVSWVIRQSTTETIGGYTGDGVSAMILAGIQANVGNSPLPYTATTSAAVTKCAPRGLLIEETRTNSVRNNTMVGAVAGVIGVGGTLPTNWALGVDSGLTATVSLGTENGYPYYSLAFAGTMAATAAPFSLRFEANNSASAASGQTWTHSCGVRLIAGTLPSNLQFVSREADAGGVALNNLSIGTSFVPSSTSINRYSATSTLANASTAFVTSILGGLQIASGTVVNFTLRFYSPQLELGAFATSVIATSTAAVVRSTDVAVITGTNFTNFYNQSEGTLIAKIRWGGLGTSQFPGVGFRGAGLEAIGFFANQGTGQGAALVRDSSGTSQAQMTMQGSGVVSGSRSVWALAYKDNDFAACSNGGSVSTDTVGSVPAINRLQVYNLDNALNGWIEGFTYYPQRLSNTSLQVMTSA